MSFMFVFVSGFWSWFVECFFVIWWLMLVWMFRRFIGACASGCLMFCWSCWWFGLSVRFVRFVKSLSCRCVRMLSVWYVRRLCLVC